MQGVGWEQGWAEWKAIAGNFKTVTERSFGVPDGVNSGQFGVGIVIDFFGLSSQASGFPVEFAYPTRDHPGAGQHRASSRTRPTRGGRRPSSSSCSPTRVRSCCWTRRSAACRSTPRTYAKAPAGFPNPFEDKSIGAAVKFDLDLSKSRYNVVNSLFDVMITYRLDDLREATGAIQEAEAALAGKSNAAAAALIAEAKALVDRDARSTRPPPARRSSTPSSRRSARRPPPRSPAARPRSSRSGTPR